MEQKSREDQVTDFIGKWAIFYHEKLKQWHIGRITKCRYLGTKPDYRVPNFKFRIKRDRGALKDLETIDMDLDSGEHTVLTRGTQREAERLAKELNL